MKKNISEILNKELRKKYALKESIDKIINETDEEKRNHHFVNYLEEMVNYGYTDEMIESELQENFIDSIGNFFSGSFLGKAGGGLLSQGKEWLISSILGLIGFKGPLAEALSTALSEMSIGDLIAVFKGRESCRRHGATVGDALAESIVTYVLQSTEGNSVAYNFIKNTLFEYVKQSQFGETVSNFICDAAYNVKQKNSGQLNPTIVRKNNPSPAIG